MTYLYYLDLFQFTLVIISTTYGSKVVHAKKFISSMTYSYMKLARIMYMSKSVSSKSAVLLEVPIEYTYFFLLTSKVYLFLTQYI